MGRKPLQENHLSWVGIEQKHVQMRLGNFQNHPRKACAAPYIEQRLSIQGERFEDKKGVQEMQDREVLLCVERREIESAIPLGKELSILLEKGQCFPRQRDAENTTPGAYERTDATLIACCHQSTGDMQRVLFRWVWR